MSRLQKVLIRRSRSLLAMARWKCSWRLVPALTGHVLDTGQWDEIHTIYKNGNGPAEDRVDVRLRQEKWG